jgi:hypothetical protein
MTAKLLPAIPASHFTDLPVPPLLAVANPVSIVMVAIITDSRTKVMIEKLKP